MNSTTEKTFNVMIFGTLLVLAAGLVTSTSLLSLSHILIIIPALYFLSKTNFKELPLSAYGLLAFSLMIVLSIIFNQDIAVNGYKPLPKVKYFLFGFLMIYPFYYYFKNFITIKKVRTILYVFCIATTIASIAGMIGMNTGYNYISMRAVNLDRNAGLSGMVLNYAHNLAFFQILLLGLIIYKEDLNNFINRKFLIIVFIINIVGLYTSFTRGAILALVVGAPFYLFKKYKIRFVGIVSALVLLNIGIYLYSGNSILRPGSDRERISQWKAAVMAFKERPILGYGYLNFEQHSVPLKKKYNIGELQFGGHAHNNFLEVLSTTGVLGFLAFMLWLVSWFIEAYRRNDVISNICFPFIIVFVVSGLTQSTISLGVNLFFIMAVYAIYQAAMKLENVKKC